MQTEPLLQRKGWFAIDGVQAGDRTLAEQLTGLEPMLAEVSGRDVLDLGCAEGLIARTCLDRGARRVIGIDNNRAFIDRANSLALDPRRARFWFGDLNQGPDADDQAVCHSDIVLALAIIHKLQDPARALRQWAAFAWRLFVIRLPLGSEVAGYLAVITLHM